MSEQLEIKEFTKAPRFRKGWKVFPCQGKEPLLKAWQDIATDDAAQIAAWSTQFPNCNWGLAMGPSGLCAIDIDGGEVGEASLFQFQLDEGFLPETREHRTARGGRHIIFRDPMRRLRNSASKLGPKIDTRGGHGFIVIPPSTFEGGAYEVLLDRPVAALPDFVPEALGRRRERAVAAADVTLDTPINIGRARISLAGYAAKGHVPGRDEDGDDYAVCCEVLNLGLSPEKALEAMLESWAPKPHSADLVDFLTTTIANAARYAQNEPGAWAVPPVADRIPSEALAKLLADSVSEPEGRPNLFSTRQHDKNQQPPRWLIEGLIAENTDAAIVAPSKFLKSFLATHLAAHIATGKRWGNRAVAGPAAVFYCAAEGAHSLRTHRVTAWEVAHGDGPYTAERLHVSATAPTLGSDSATAFVEDARAQMKPGEKAGLFIVDTMNRALNGADEDKSSTASAYFNMLAPIRAALGCSTLTVHHMGKDVAKGARGSSAFYAGFDTVIVIDKAAKDEATGSYFLTVRVDKQKDGEDGQEFILQARKVETPNGASLALYPAGEDDLKRVAGKQVGLRRTDLSGALVRLGACPDGANAWTGKIGGVPTRPVAIEVARARIAADGGGREPTEKEIDVLVAALNKGARQGGPFAAYVVREAQGGRQWAVAPGLVNGGDDDA